MSEGLTAREVIAAVMFRQVPKEADEGDFNDVADLVMAGLRQHGYVILPLAKLATLEQRLSIMHDIVEGIGPALAGLQAEAVKT